jgi:hypothetical protein
VPNAGYDEAERAAGIRGLVISPNVCEQHVRAARRSRVEQQYAKNGHLARPKVDRTALSRPHFNVPEHLKQHQKPRYPSVSAHVARIWLNNCVHVSTEDATICPITVTARPSLPPPAHEGQP